MKRTRVLAPFLALLFFSVALLPAALASHLGVDGTVASTVPSAAAQSRGLPDSACTVVTSSTLPSPMQLCETADVTVTMAISCPIALPVHLVIAIDRSQSLEPELGAIRKSAGDVIDELDFEAVRTQVAVLSHGFRVKVVQDFTDQESKARSSLNRVRHDTSDIGEAPGAAIDKAVSMLEDERDEDGTAVSPIEIVLLYGDGCDPTEPACRSAAQRAAATAKGKGVKIVTVCYETERSNCSDYRAMSTSPDLAFRAPAGRLPARMREFQDEGRGVTVVMAELLDVLGPQISYVEGSGMPAPKVTGQELEFTWAEDEMTDTLVVHYQVTAAEVGTLDLHTAASEVNMEDSLERSSRPAELPGGWLEITGPCIEETPTPTATNTPADTPTPVATDTPTEVPPTDTPVATATPVTQFAYLPISTRGACKPSRYGNDVVLVIDASNSMNGTTGGERTKIEAAKQAAKDFAALLESDDRAAVVAFADEAWIALELTGDLVAIEAAIDGIETAPGTRMDNALISAFDALYSVDGERVPARLDSRSAVVLLGDGRHSDDETRGDLKYWSSEFPNTNVFTIGLGDDVDEDLMREIATAPSYYFSAPTVDDLSAVYGTVAAALPCPGGVMWPVIR